MLSLFALRLAIIAAAASAAAAAVLRHEWRERRADRDEINRRVEEAFDRRQAEAYARETERSAFIDRVGAGAAGVPAEFCDDENNARALGLVNVL